MAKKRTEDEPKRKRKVKEKEPEPVRYDKSGKWKLILKKGELCAQSPVLYVREEDWDRIIKIANKKGEFVSNVLLECIYAGINIVEKK